MIAPDGFLHFLPFGLLTQKVGDRLSYLIEQHDIVYCFGGDSLLKESTALPKDMVFYGIDNPDFDLSLEKQQIILQQQQNLDKENIVAFRGDKFSLKSRKLWQNLPPSNEIIFAEKILKEAYPKSKIIVHSKENALEPLVKKSLSQADWVHIVSHGFFFESKEDTENEQEKFGLAKFQRNFLFGQSKGEFVHPLLLSGVVLAGANNNTAIVENNNAGIAANKNAQSNSNTETNEDSEDGYLTAQEIALMKLSRIRCAIFSCCGTGLGNLDKASGLAGLKWALEYSGVQNTILTLWDINNLSSPIVNEIYSYNLQGKIPISSALNIIQRKNSQLTNGLSHPGFWAAFICNGLPNSNDKFSESQLNFIAQKKLENTQLHNILASIPPAENPILISNPLITVANPITAKFVYEKNGTIVDWEEKVATIQDTLPLKLKVTPACYIYAYSNSLKNTDEFVPIDGLSLTPEQFVNNECLLALDLATLSKQNNIFQGKFSNKIPNQSPKRTLVWYCSPQKLDKPRDLSNFIKDALNNNKIVFKGFDEEEYPQETIKWNTQDEILFIFLPAKSNPQVLAKFTISHTP